ncbi:RHS repeat-associated core domain protein containing protein [Brevibacillus sp. CF112]|nr:RHS repeat-associated core domain protein containing protein [Brevibacillus sp. CF112]
MSSRGRLLATKQQTGSVTDTTHYVYLNGQVIEELTQDGRLKARNVFGNQLIWRKDYTTNQEGTYYYNSHGDVVKIKGPSGNVLNMYEYDIWGNLIADKVKETMMNPFAYAGEMYDKESGFYYLRARYYDPKMGRFVSEDTVKGQVDNPLSLNRYTYVSNNPLKFVDPSGHIQEMTGGVGGFSSPAEEYMHWAKVAARRAYEEGIEPEDAVRKYVPTQYQREVLSTAIVTFNNTVGMNHGDAPDLGLGVAGAGAAVGTIRNPGKNVANGTGNEFNKASYQKPTANKTTLWDITKIW